MTLKLHGVYFVLCPKQGTKIEGVVLNRVCVLGIVCPKRGQGFKPSAAHRYPNINRVSPPPSPRGTANFSKQLKAYQINLDQCLGNCPPTPPLSQHFSLS